MKRRMILGLLVHVASYFCVVVQANAAQALSGLKQGDPVATFKLNNLYSDSDGTIVAAKFIHEVSGAPVFLVEAETVPQMFLWFDTPAHSNQGLPHALEHLLVRGTKGGYFLALENMRLAQVGIASYQDFNYYGVAASAGMSTFSELFHACLDAVYHPDFTDNEVEREVYHFGVKSDAAPAQRSLIEGGTIYNEIQSRAGRFDYYFQLNKRVLGPDNPFGFDTGGEPEELQKVTPQQIRQFHAEHYKLGPTTGFVFALTPDIDIHKFLQKVSDELQALPRSNSPDLAVPKPNAPKYPIRPDPNTEPAIYPFASTSDSGAGFVHFAWKPVQTDSQTELKLLQLFFKALADGQESLLYRSIVDRNTRTVDLGATGVSSGLFTGDSPFYPVPIAEVSGIPGNRISPESIKTIQSLILSQIQDISNYSDGDSALSDFNDLIAGYAKSMHRSERVWVRNAPEFGSRKTDWKEQFELLEMDPSFVRSISEEPVWKIIDQDLKSSKNIWRNLIKKFGLTEVPYSTAGVPSTQSLANTEKAKQQRIQNKTQELLQRYQTTEIQEAFARLEKEESAKTQEIEASQNRISRPRFLEHPPLSPDDQIRYRQLRVADVPVVASIFTRPPTLDVGLSFDLRQIPRKYYKYLPLLPRCLDSLGLKTGDSTDSYQRLLTQIGKDVYGLSISYDANPASKRADLVIRVSAADLQELRTALALVRSMILYNALDESRVDRLRDLIASRLVSDDAFLRQPVWMFNSSLALRNETNPLFLALNSDLTRAHWDSRMKWRFHATVSHEETERLEEFTKSFLALLSGQPRAEIARALASSKATGLDQELVEYWKKNLAMLPDRELVEHLQHLSSEVQDDLRIGASKTIDELRDLQRLVINRRLLNVDLTLSEAVLPQVRSELQALLTSIPDTPIREKESSQETGGEILGKLEAVEFHARSGQYPHYVGVVSPGTVAGNAYIYADFPGYDQFDRHSLITVLADGLLGGEGPHSLYTNNSRRGLAYGTGIVSEPTLKRIYYYASRSPDITAAIRLFNSLAQELPSSNDVSLVDNALRQAFFIPRTVLTPSQRGRAIALDIRDGVPPEVARRFYQSLLKLRLEPALLAEVTHAALGSLSPLLMNQGYRSQQEAARSLFFFAGPEKTLDDVQKQFDLRGFIKLWPSDFWTD